MSASAYTITSTASRVFYFQRCCNCDVEFGVTDAFDDRRRADKRSFYCPNGHGQSYTESDADRLRKELERTKARLTAAADQAAAARADRDKVTRQLSAAKGQATKLAKRAAAGVCPCCHRTFANMARHMTGQHPDYAASAS